MNSMIDRTEPEGRVARRQRKNREALVKAARRVMAEKGIDAATMLEIAELADVGAGTIYNYFKSKDELAIVVLEEMMHDLALRIETLTTTVDDPAEVYAFGVRTVLDAATTDLNWRQMLYRSEVIADALFRRMGPFAIRDLRRAVDASRFSALDPELVWHLTAHAIVGVSLAITTGRMSPDIKDEVVIRLLCMAGLETQAATELAGRPEPEARARSSQHKSSTKREQITVTARESNAI